MKPFFVASDSDNPWVQNGEWISITKANRVIEERSTVIYSDAPGSGYWQVVKDSHVKLRVNNPLSLNDSTHQALLINITPIEKLDTAEGLLKELLECSITISMDKANLLSRARKLLSEGKK